MKERHIEWTAKEAMAMAYCWSEFSVPEYSMVGMDPLTYWRGIDERARNECRTLANELLLVALAKGQAVAVLPPEGLREGELDRLKIALGMTKEHRVRQILMAVWSVFDRREPTLQRIREKYGAGIVA